MSFGGLNIVFSVHALADTTERLDPDGPDNVKKATCWWVNGGLPKLRPTGILDGSTARDEVFRMAPTADPEERRMARSKFTPGHAAAIAQQWGDFVMARKGDVTNPATQLATDPEFVTSRDAA